MHTYEVGKLYNPKRTTWAEANDLSIGVNGTELRLFLRNPTEAEILAVRRGTAKFAWISGEHAALLAYRLGDLDWADVSYHTGHEQPEHNHGVPGEQGQPIVATILLVDAVTGILRAMRAMSWSARAADVIRATIRQQQTQGLNPSAEMAWVTNLYDRYPSTAKLVKARADVTWTGGTPDAAPGTGPDANPQEPTASTPTGGDSVQEALAAAGIQPNPLRRYHTALPAELARWYAYTDGGHSIVVAVKTLYERSTDPRGCLVAVPVRAVLRAGWNTTPEDYVLADVPYDDDLGVVSDSTDDEF